MFNNVHKSKCSRKFKKLEKGGRRLDKVEEGYIRFKKIQVGSRWLPKSSLRPQFEVCIFNDALDCQKWTKVLKRSRRLMINFVLKTVLEGSRRFKTVQEGSRRVKKIQEGSRTFMIILEESRRFIEGHYCSICMKQNEAWSSKRKATLL